MNNQKYSDRIDAILKSLTIDGDAMPIQIDSSNGTSLLVFELTQDVFAKKVLAVFEHDPFFKASLNKTPINFSLSLKYQLVDGQSL